MATKRLSVGRRGFLKSTVALVTTAQAAAPSRATAQESPTTANQSWLALTRETALEPQLAIIDTHHHFWDVPDRTPERYLLAQLVADVKGHNVRQTVFIECGSMYRADGPEEFRVVGETEFVPGLVPLHDRPLHSGALHVREQLPGRQTLVFLHSVVEPVQEADEGFFGE
jgi:hypothetical protein